VFFSARLDLQVLVPHIEDVYFDDWWHKMSSMVNGQVKQGLNSIIILMAWLLWNH